MHDVQRQDALQSLQGPALSERLAQLDRELQARIPTALAERVDPEPWLGQVWHGYWALQGDRQMLILPMGGSIPGPVSYLARSQWFRDHDIDTDRAESWFLPLWSAMDAERSRFEESRPKAEE